MRLAVEAKYVKFMLGNDNVAIIIKRPVMINVGCGIRHNVTWRSNFLLRGGVKLFPANSMIVEVDEKAYKAKAYRKLKYATIVLAEEMADITFTNVDEKGNILPKPMKRYEKFIKLEKPEIIADGYMVFEVNGGEAKLTNEDPTHILFIFEHSVNSRAYDADVKIKPESLVVFNESTACKTKSVALAIALAPVNNIFTVCYNRAPYRHGDFEPYYKCYNIKTTIPPQQEFIADTPNPDQLSTSPDEVI